MKRFHFPLRPVAVIRGHRELRARLALAASTQACQRTEARCAAAQARAAETARAITAARCGTVRAGDQAVFMALHRRDCAAAADAETQAAAARADVERRRAECVEASRQMKVVARLEEHARAVHRAESLAAEQQQLDEISRMSRGLAGMGFQIDRAGGGVAVR